MASDSHPPGGQNDPQGNI
jgi:hypothetical protein